MKTNKNMLRNEKDTLIFPVSEKVNHSLSVLDLEKEEWLYPEIFA